MNLGCARSRTSRRSHAGDRLQLLQNSIVLHPFANGNKRTAYEIARLFLRVNGCDIKAKPEDVYRFLVSLASSKIFASSVENWIATNLTELKD